MEDGREVGPHHEVVVFRHWVTQGQTHDRCGLPTWLEMRKIFVYSYYNKQIIIHQMKWLYE